MSITHLKFMECQINDSNFWKSCNYVNWVPEDFLAMFGRRQERRKRKKLRRRALKTQNRKARMKSLWYPG